MIWFGTSYIIFCRSFIKFNKLCSTKTCSYARVRQWETQRAPSYLNSFEVDVAISTVCSCMAAVYRLKQFKLLYMLTFPVDLYHESNALINSGCSAEPVQQLALQHEISTTTPFFPFFIFPTQDKIQTPILVLQYMCSSSSSSDTALQKHFDS